MGKKTRTNFKSKDLSSTKALELVHIDLCGPTRTTSLQSEKYCMLLISDFSHMTWVIFLKEKSEALQKFKSFKVLVENEKDLKIKCLHFDNGGEFTSNEYASFYENNGIKR